MQLYIWGWKNKKKKVINEKIIQFMEIIILLINKYQFFYDE